MPSCAAKPAKPIAHVVTLSVFRIVQAQLRAFARQGIAPYAQPLRSLHASTPTVIQRGFQQYAFYITGQCRHDSRLITHKPGLSPLPQPTTSAHDRRAERSGETREI